MRAYSNNFAHLTSISDLERHNFLISSFTFQLQLSIILDFRHLEKVTKIHKKLYKGTSYKHNVSHTTEFILSSDRKYARSTVGYQADDYYSYYSFSHSFVLSKLKVFICTSSRFRVAANMKERRYIIFVAHVEQTTHEFQTAISLTLRCKRIYISSHELAHIHIHRFVHAHAQHKQLHNQKGIFVL